MLPYYGRTETGDVDRVEVLRVTSGGEVKQTVPCPNALAMEVVRLWREMPVAEQMRCHLPRFGLRFFRRQRQTLQATLCWRCNNIWIALPEGNVISTFDGGHATAQSLRKILSSVADPTATGSS